MFSRKFIATESVFIQIIKERFFYYYSFDIIELKKLYSTKNLISVIIKWVFSVHFLYNNIAVFMYEGLQHTPLICDLRSKSCEEVT